MKITLKTTNFKITSEIREYLDKKIIAVARFLPKKKTLDPVFRIELEKVAAKHHKTGELYRSEINLDLEGEVFRVEETEADILSSIDEVKDELIRQLKKAKDKRITKKRVVKRK